MEGNKSESFLAHKALVTATVVATLLSFALLRYVLYPLRPRIISSPRRTSHTLDEQEKSRGYHDHYFPGQRDVDTPYGSVRVYEFGPKTGRKVLFLHGISTSCMTLTTVANELVAKHGCRVMLFDLFGRGFSDGVGDLPYDARLFVAQTLCVLASSPLAWTGAGPDQGCTVVGYSLGGGIAVHFATAFPNMVKSLVLLAPAGMIRGENFGRASMILFRSGLVPDAILERLTRWRLKRPIGASAKKRTPPAAAVSKSGAIISSSTSDTKSLTPHVPGEKVVDAAISEAADTVNSAGPNEIQRKTWNFVTWQVSHHAGFIPAFMSTVRHAPMLDQHEAWRKLAKRPKLSTCFIFGAGDELVNEEDYRIDALPLVGGEEHVRWEVLSGGHDFPMVAGEETVRRIVDFWGSRKEE